MRVSLAMLALLACLIASLALLVAAYRPNWPRRSLDTMRRIMAAWFMV